MPMPTIVDNIETSLIQELQRSLSEKPRRLDSCIGYFNFRGFKKLLKIIDGIEPDNNKPAVRLLIGVSNNSTKSEIESFIRNDIEPAKPNGIESLRQTEVSIQNEEFEKEKDSLEEQLTWGSPTLEDKEAIGRLAEYLAAKKIQIRFFGKFPLHAKLYLCHREVSKSEIIGYVGSSNLTMAGLEGQGELNVDILEDDATLKLQKWFDDRWEQAEDYDLTDHVYEVIQKSWAAEKQPDPYLIYLKLAYHLSRDAREGLSEYEIPEKLDNELLEFQSSAVRITARNIITRGGAMIGDVVGLGKTIMATAVAKVLEEQHGFQTLIICPPKLKEMWEDYRHEYKIRAKIMSIGKVQSQLEKEHNYQLVIIDESHNLRTRGGRRWTAIRDYIESRGSKLLLLTATPYNKQMSDIGGQLGLFISGDADLGLRPETAIQEAGGDVEFAKNTDINLSSLKAFEKSEHIEDWQRLLGNYMIRRTRSFIEDRYAETDSKTKRKYLNFSDGEKYFLPDRDARPVTLDPLLFNDPTNIMVSDETIESVNNLHLPRYGLAAYTTDKSMENASSEELSIIKSSKGNARSLRGLTRTMLFKRLSSNPQAFILSLKRHLIKNIIARQCLESKEKLPTSDYETNIEYEYEGEETENPDQDIEESLENNLNYSSNNSSNTDEYELLAKAQRGKLDQTKPKGIHFLNPEIFMDARLQEQNQSLLDHLNEDIDSIKKLLDSFGKASYETDTKLQKLIEILTKTHPDEKIIIFTEYVDTAKYLYSALQVEEIEDLELVTSNTSNPLSTVRRFSPVSNGNTDMAEGEKELRILITTDVLSEGLNLQDSRILINFDLPWAIIKLFQRAGRIDRLKQQAPKVIIYSLLPFKNVEDAINLQQKLQKRLKENAEVVGSDELIFGSPEEISKAQKRFIEKGDIQTFRGLDVDYASEAYEIWNNADSESQQKARALPNNAHSTLGTSSIDSRKNGLLVYTNTVHTSGRVDRITFVAPDEEVKGIGFLEALQMAKCEKGEPAQKQREDFHKLINEAYAQIRNSNTGIPEGQVSGIRKRVRERIKGCLDKPDQISDMYPKSKLTEAFTVLGKAPLTNTAEKSLSKTIRQNLPTLIDDVFRLMNNNKLIIDVNTDPGLVEIMCSVGFTE